MGTSLNTGDSTSKSKELFYSEGGQTLTQFIHCDCGVPIPAKIQNPTGHFLEQTDLAVPP